MGLRRDHHCLQGGGMLSGKMFKISLKLNSFFITTGEKEKELNNVSENPSVTFCRYSADMQIP